MDHLFNPYQKASLATTLRMFEDNLRQAQDWLNGQQVHGILFQRRLHIPLSQQVALQKRISAALSEIALMAEKFHLEQKFEDPASLLAGQMSIAWANLIDSQAHKLKRYGKVHPDLAQELDPHLQRLAQAAMELATLFGNNLSNPSFPDDEILSADEE